MQSLPVGRGPFVLVTAGTILLTTYLVTLTRHDAAAGRDWPAYGGNAEGTRYSPLTEINRGTVGRLDVAWQFDPADVAISPSTPPGTVRFQGQPIVVDGVLYSLTPGGGNLIALDGATGGLKWSWHAGVRGAGRGVTYWTDGREKRLFVGFGRYIYAIDADTGQPHRDFGQDGRIDLHDDLGRDPDRQSVSLTTPGVIYRDRLIVGGRTSEGLPASPGDVRAYDVKSGALRWSFHTIPHPGEYGYDTWPREAWTYSGSANNWAGMAVDTHRGIVYVPTGSAAADFYGANRVGDNLFANTLLALNAETGERIWHFQAVRHDIWDRDFPSPPTLVTVRHHGQSIDAVAQTTKQGFLFLFDRTTGAPLFPIEYRRVPASTVAGEVAADTQPFPLKPASYSRQTLTADMLTNRTADAHQWAVDQFQALRSEGLFVPFTVGKETVVFPGFDGGAEWGGSAFDPQTGIIYVNANDIAWTSSLRASAASSSVGRGTYLNECASCHGDNMGGGTGFPPLVGIASRRPAAQVAEVIRNGSARMPGFPSFDANTLEQLVAYVMRGDAKESPPGSRTNSESPTALKYTFTGYHRWYDPDGFPAVAPPWGTLNAINLNTGEYAWKVPLGEYPELAAAGVDDTGTENYGGPLVTAGRLVFIGATNFDKKFRAFDKDTGRLLWETTMVNSGNATPITYQVNGRQYVVIAAFGGYARRPAAGAAPPADDAAGGGPGRGPLPLAKVGAGKPSGGAFVAFALPRPPSTPN
jgi:quinoprotein glucose dehydrogenase